jgi:hypothetical protein
MKKYVAASVCVVVTAELVAVVLLDRELFSVASGLAVAIVLLALRGLLAREGKLDTSADGCEPSESLRRWLSRTETLIGRSESTRRDWDRHLRPMLARQFELATGQRQLRNPTAFQATGQLLFGAELWAWVDPQNVSRTGGDEPGPGRATLAEILQRMERV